MIIALTSINPVIGDFQNNIKQIKTAAAKAVNAGCSLLILPEMALSGTPPLNLLKKPRFLEAHDRALACLLGDIQNIAVLCGVISRDSSAGLDTIYNSAILFENGKIQFVIHKHFLDYFGNYREKDYFEIGEVNLPVPFQGKRLGITLGREIAPAKPGCKFKDIHNPIAEFHQNGGADLFINLAAIPFNRNDSRERLGQLTGICRKYQTPLLHVNQAGGQDSLLFDGRCLAINEKGEISSYTLPFEDGMLVVDSGQMDKAENLGKIYKRDLENILQGLVTGIRDFVSKSDFSQVILGLNGDLDSALTCFLAYLALGSKNILGVALPSPGSTPESVSNARQLAENLGIDFKVIPIADPLQTIKNTLSPFFQELSEDNTEANLQAGIRGNILMALADKFNRLLLATGNKSEVTTGYCPLYSDSCKTLAPLADIPKTMVYELAALINRDQKWKGIITESILSKTPGAELIPGQKNQDDLPSYEILDQVINYRLEQGCSIAEIAAKGYDPVIVKDIIQRLEKNRFKRLQLPPTLWITSREFGRGNERPLTTGYQEDYD